jgi:DNA-binding NarL/FixJ family response regulator
METISRLKKLETSTKINSNDNINPSFEVVVIEDNHLTNTILSRALDSTINTIHNLKQISVKFSSFQNGGDFLSYFESREFGESKLIVFSDYHLEDNMNGARILRNIKQKNPDATVIIMSDTTNKQISVDTLKMGAYCFLPKDHKTSVICSELLFQMVN